VPVALALTNPQNISLSIKNCHDRPNSDKCRTGTVTGGNQAETDVYNEVDVGDLCGITVDPSFAPLYPQL
jgi:hypothetical protein